MYSVHGMQHSNHIVPECSECSENMHFGFRISIFVIVTCKKGQMICEPLNKRAHYKHVTSGVSMLHMIQRRYQYFITNNFGSITMRINLMSFWKICFII